MINKQLLRAFLEKQQHTEIMQLMPKTDDGTLTFLFKDRIIAFCVAIKNKNRDLYYKETITEDHVKNIFENIADRSIGEIPTNTNPVLVKDLRDFLSDELKLIHKYRKDLEKWGNKGGTFNQLLNESKHLKLSEIDSVIFILSHYFNIPN